MSVPFFAYWKNSFFSFCFYNIQHTLATDGLLGGRWTVDGGLEMLPAKASLAAFTIFSNQWTYSLCHTMEAQYDK